MSLETSYNVAIIGGGFTGAAAAIQLLRASKVSISVRIFEPRPQIGYGLAYSSEDPDHRLNGSPDTHCVDPADPKGFERWCEHNDAALTDPEATAPDGRLFVRRRQFGDYVNAAFRRHAECNPSQSTAHHFRQLVTRVTLTCDRYAIWTSCDHVYPADMVILATGNVVPALPQPFEVALREQREVVASPYDLTRMQSIDPSSRVLVLGAGLTALDAVSTLLRKGHSGAITALSRRGLRPRPQSPIASGANSAEPLVDLIDLPAPPYFASAASAGLRNLVREVRHQIVEREVAGGTWHEAFDELRNAVWQLWPRLSTKDKRWFLRRLRPWYDAHRFRAPPQNDAMVRKGEDLGLVRFVAARVDSVKYGAGDSIIVSMTERGSAARGTYIFDELVNCTGLDPAGGAIRNGVVKRLLSDGYAKIDASGVGLAVTDDCSSLGAAGLSMPRLYIVGPPTAGTFGDPLGGVFIVAQIRRVLPAWLQAIDVDMRSKSFSSLRRVLGVICAFVIGMLLLSEHGSTADKVAVRTGAHPGFECYVARKAPAYG